MPSTLDRTRLPNGRNVYTPDADFANEASAQQQFMAGDLRIGGIFLERWGVELAHTHDIRIRHSFPISSIKASTMASSSTLRTTFPCEKHHARPLAARNADIGVGSFAGSVHHASHDRYLERLVQPRDAILNLPRHADKVDLAATARRAADELGGAPAQVERRKQRPTCANFLHGIVGKRDAQRVADPLFKKNPRGRTRS